MTVKINKPEGTIAFSLGGVPCVMKVTWEAVAAIETDLGFGMVQLARRVAAGGFGLKDLAVVILHGLKASGTEGGPTFEKVADQIMKVGLLDEDVIQAVSEFCNFALSGGEDPKKE